MEEKENLRLVAVKEFNDNVEMYHIVDFLNKSLKDRNLVFGIRKDGEKRIITIYEASANNC